MLTGGELRIVMADLNPDASDGDRVIGLIRGRVS
jgi:hypothetical protein